MPHTEQPIVARSRAFNDIMALARRLSGASCPVLITGESGTGKELIARIIHDASPSRQGPYVAINVAALPADLVESQLFGHVAGAFTGAQRDRAGAFRSAHGGTLLLDEIGDLPLNAQAKLLRVLEEKEVLPLGADTPVPIDVRIVTATSRKLERLVEGGLFRSDLLFRINVVRIEIPPLRERPDDIPVLAEYYCERFCRESGIPPRKIDGEAMQRLLAHGWEGNVRELAHVIERAVLLSDGDSIAVDDLPREIVGCGCADGNCQPTLLGDAVEAFKQRHIISVLESVNGDRGKAARLLGLSPATLFRYIRKYGLKGYALQRTH